MEYMKKMYAQCGDGILELCNTIYSIAQALNYEPICQCDSCVERIGKFELSMREKKRENELKSLTFNMVLDRVRSVFDDDDDDNIPSYGNDYNYEEDEDGRYIWYQTGGKLSFQITELYNDNTYLFEVCPPEMYFRAGSKLYESLSKIGYSLVSDNNIRIGETYLMDNQQCAVCGQDLSSNDYKYFKHSYCPRCGRLVST